MFLHLVEAVGNDLSRYDDTEAWPSLFDDFVSLVLNSKAVLSELAVYSELVFMTKLSIPIFQKVEWANDKANQNVHHSKEESHAT